MSMPDPADGPPSPTGARDRGPGKGPEVSSRLRALEALDTRALRREWRRLYRVDPPGRIRRDLLLLAVAWKLQEQAYGGLSAATRRRLAALERDGGAAPARAARLKPGARLVREWRGRTYTVSVTETGYEWNGQDWGSLSKIAGSITGGHWSGPRFFGLTGPRTGAGKTDDE